MPFGCFVALRSLSHSLLLLQPSFGQLLVSFMPLHSFRPSLRFITPRSYLKYLLQGLAHLATLKAKHKWCTFLFAKPSLQYSLGSIPLHYVLHSLQSHSVHPLPIILLALLACYINHIECVKQITTVLIKWVLPQLFLFTVFNINIISWDIFLRIRVYASSSKFNQVLLLIISHTIFVFGISIVNMKMKKYARNTHAVSNNSYRVLETNQNYHWWSSNWKIKPTNYHPISLPSAGKSVA